MKILTRKEYFIAVAKEQIRQIISENNISSVADVYPLLRDNFKDILQELLEAEIDASLGYDKNQKDALDPVHRRNRDKDYSRAAYRRNRDKVCSRGL